MIYPSSAKCHSSRESIEQLSKYSQNAWKQESFVLKWFFLTIYTIHHIVWRVISPKAMLTRTHFWKLPRLGAKIHRGVKYNLTIILCKPSHFFCHKCFNEIKAFKSLWRQWALTFVDKRKAVVESAWTNLNSWTYKERLQNALYNQRNPGGNNTDYRTNTMLFFLLLVTGTFHPLLTKGKRRMCFHETINLVSSTWTKQGALFINPIMFIKLV